MNFEPELESRNAIDALAALRGFPKEDQAREYLAGLLREVLQSPEQFGNFVREMFAYSEWPGPPAMLQVANAVANPDAGKLKEWTPPAREPEGPPVCENCQDRWIVRISETQGWVACRHCPDGREYGPTLAQSQNESERRAEERKRNGQAPRGLRKPTTEEMTLVLNEIMRRRRGDDV